MQINFLFVKVVWIFTTLNMHYQLTLTLELQRDFNSFEEAQHYFDNEFLQKILQNQFQSLDNLPDVVGKITEVLEVEAIAA